jgi:GNAT superfamily N-acetyltransferase
MVIEVSVHEISDYIGVRSNRKLFEMLDGERDYLALVNAISGYGMSGGRIVVAVDNSILVGCYAYNPVTSASGCYSEDFIAEVGPNARAVYAHNIWVRPSHRGSGLSKLLRDAYSADAKARGYTHSVGFMPQTVDIEQWAMALKDVKILSAKDTHGGWITVRPFA